MRAHAGSVVRGARVLWEAAASTAGSALPPRVPRCRPVLCWRKGALQCRGGLLCARRGMCPWRSAALGWSPRQTTPHASEGAEDTGHGLAPRTHGPACGVHATSRRAGTPQPQAANVVQGRRRSIRSGRLGALAALPWCTAVRHGVHAACSCHPAGLVCAPPCLASSRASCALRSSSASSTLTGEEWPRHEGGPAHTPLQLLWCLRCQAAPRAGTRATCGQQAPLHRSWCCAHAPHRPDSAEGPLGGNGRLRHLAYDAAAAWLT